MKIKKIKNLNTILCLALACNLSTQLNAQLLQEAISNIDVSGLLKYQYKNNRLSNQNLTNPQKSGEVEQLWRSEIQFITPTLNNVSFALGLLYENTNNPYNSKDPNNTNQNKSFLGSGLGAGKDGEFGVSTFAAHITPTTTATRITLGKTTLLSPYHDPSNDRAVGVSILNTDLGYLGLFAGAYHSWMLDDLDHKNQTSINKPLYMLAALLEHEAPIGNLTGQLWYLHAHDLINHSIFAELGWDNDIFHLNSQYVFTQINNSNDSALRGIAQTFYDTNLSQNFKKYSDFLSLEGGVDFGIFGIPLNLNLGYLTNTKDNFAILLDNEGSLQIPGELWFDNATTKANLSALSNINQKGQSKSLYALYASLSYDILENLTFGLDYIWGQNAIKSKALSYDLNFYELTPSLSYAFSHHWDLRAYYASLKTTSSQRLSGQNANYERRNKLFLEASYYF